MTTFFDVERHAVVDAPAAPWRSMTALVDEPNVLDARISQVRAALGGEWASDAAAVRVAASVAHLGLMARLLSPALAVAAESGRLAYSALTELWWRGSLAGAFPMSVPWPAPTDDVIEPAALATRLADELIGGPIIDLERLFAARFSVPERVLRGNVASAINGAAMALAAVRADLGQRGAQIASLLLATQLFVDEQGEVGLRFRRHSCCLIYRSRPVGLAAICGDCVLALA